MPDDPVTVALAPVRALYQAALDEPDAEKFLDLLVALRTVKREVDVLVRDADRAAVDTFSGQKEWVVGSYALEVRNSRARKFTAEQSADLRAAVARHARYDMDTGEARTVDEALAVYTEAFRCGGAEARVTWLKAHDIDVDEYSTGEWRASVTIAPAPIEPEPSREEPMP